MIIYTIIKHLNPIGIVGIKIDLNIAYLEWLRDWPDDARQPTNVRCQFQQNDFILGDKV